ncbi:MAG: SGNH/GDSL hydrolase family protein [Erysipelotrichales bacterium]|nr:SGNH/GDSL hydrolase family protein [Erysipelotrichales bacterium]
MKNNYIIIGDSLVYGIGGYKQNGWVSMFKNKLLNDNQTKYLNDHVHCIGFPGATSKDIAQKIKSIIETYYFNEVNNIFIISVGVNDTQTSDGKQKNSIDEYQDNIYKIINAIRFKPNSKLIFIGLTKIQEQSGLFMWKDNKFFDNSIIEIYNQRLIDICTSNELEYISMKDLLGKTDYDDGLHPNDGGYKKILERIIDLLK